MKILKKHVLNMHHEDFSDWHNPPNIIIRIAKSGTCPTCGEEVNYLIDEKKCTNCKQRLDWDDSGIKKNYPLFVVMVALMWLVCWAVSSTVVGCMAWAIGSDFTFLNSVAVATGFWALLCGGVWLISKVDDDFR